MSEQNVQLVQRTYAAFLRGDIDGILDTLDEEIVWDPVIGAGPHVPQAGKREGKAGVRQFFESLARSIEFEKFEPREFIAQGDRVVVLGAYAVRPKSTGRRLASEWVMLFRILNGRIVEFREFVDSAAVNAAYDRRGATR